MWKQQLQQSSNQQIYRVGTCQNCGDCCILWVTDHYERCRFYDLKAEQHCTIYETRPTVCRDFPRCAMDVVNKPLCGYSFVDEKGRIVDAYEDKRVTLRLVK
jgi:hypothetical protein